MIPEIASQPSSNFLNISIVLSSDWYALGHMDPDSFLRWLIYEGWISFLSGPFLTVFIDTSS